MIDALFVEPEDGRRIVKDKTVQMVVSAMAAKNIDGKLVWQVNEELGISVASLLNKTFRSYPPHDEEQLIRFGKIVNNYYDIHLPILIRRTYRDEYAFRKREYLDALKRLENA